MTDSEMITVSEAAKLSGYTPQHIRLLIRQGLLGARRAGGIWLIEASSHVTYSIVGIVIYATARSKSLIHNIPKHNVLARILQNYLRIQGDLSRDCLI